MANDWTPERRRLHSVKIKAALALRRQDPRPPIKVQTKSIYSFVLRLLGLLKPRERLLPSVWAERHRVLPLGSSSKSGKWRNFPFQVQPMDAIADPGCFSLTLDWASQVLGKSSIIECDVGWIIDQSPAPIIATFPTETNAEAWSKNRFGPMIQATQCLSKLIDTQQTRRGVRSGYGTNTICHKHYPGGWFLAGGSNSPAQLKSHSTKYAVFDETDSYPPSAGAEGDVILLVSQRQSTWPDSFQIKTSTPTVKNFSRIESELEGTDKRKWFVTCPHCKHEFVIMWAHIKWPKSDNKGSVLLHGGAAFDGPATKPGITHYIDQAYIECPACEAHFDDEQRKAMVWDGRWIATCPWVKGNWGFWANAFITLLRCKRGFTSWMHYWAHRFFEAKRLGPVGMRTFQNLVLAESWEVESEKAPDHQILYARREVYHEDNGEIILPERCLFLVAGADIQADRIEAEIVGFGADDETWGIQYKVFRGSTETPDLFNEFDAWIQRKWKHPSGYLLSPAAACLDSGNKPTQVYAYVYRCAPRPIYAIKGVRGYEPNWVNRSGGQNHRLFLLGVDTPKEALYSRLRLVDHGPGFVHFPQNHSCGYDLTYFQQLTSENMLTAYTNGRQVRYFDLSASGARNEALDARVYAMAAAVILNPDYVAIQRNLAKPPLHDWRPKHEPEPALVQAGATQETVAKPGRRKGSGWFKAY